MPGRPGPVGYLEREAFFVNLSGDYRYMSAGYYMSQELEGNGATVHPTCKEILDGYVVPLFLDKAQLTGLAVPTYYITNGYFEPPVIVDAVNPFMSRHSIVLKTGHQERVAKSLTRNYTYAVCCQELPPGARVCYLRSVLGWCALPRHRELARAVWEIFRIPLALVRFISLSSGSLLLSCLRPLPLKELKRQERLYLDKTVTWLT